MENKQGCGKIFEYRKNESVIVETKCGFFEGKKRKLCPECQDQLSDNCIGEKSPLTSADTQSQKETDLLESGNTNSEVSSDTFVLADKMFQNPFYFCKENKLCYQEDVKEFIRRLKRKLTIRCDKWIRVQDEQIYRWISDEIDKLSGFGGKE